ncbi:hypothetical protein Q5P01_000187 [Channa striata]|uniref:Uncharacterized protein n=1 Tax=Channa striata TaxID=64152 RepID=A0AA88LMH6_CHASR|nr:hypothetical protein Q5P01_000187 [Channa striata]
MAGRQTTSGRVPGVSEQRDEATRKQGEKDGRQERIIDTRLTEANGEGGRVEGRKNELAGDFIAGEKQREEAETTREEERGDYRTTSGGRQHGTAAREGWKQRGAIEGTADRRRCSGGHRKDKCADGINRRAKRRTGEIEIVTV